MKLESMNNQKNDLLTAIKKYIKNVTIGTCTFAFAVSTAVLVSKELDDIKKNQKAVLVMEESVEVSTDLTSIRQVIQMEQTGMIETMFAQAIAEDDERVKQEALQESLEKEEAMKNETNVVVVASTSNITDNQSQVGSQSGNTEQTVTKQETKQPEVAQTVENATVTTTERENVTLVPAESEYDMLCRIVEAEATGKDIEAKLMVANVVLNRVVSSQFPNTIEGVIFQHRGSVYQFSPISDGRYYSVTVTDGTREAVNRAMAGEDNSQGALYFVSPKYGNTSWFDRNLNFLFYYGGHNFYK